MDRITELQKRIEYNKKGVFPAIFIGQSYTRLVRGRSKWKVTNHCIATTEDPSFEKYIQEQEGFELTKLEELYKEFCEKAYTHITCHSSLQGEAYPHRIVFPHFFYEIIPSKFPV